MSRIYRGFEAQGAGDYVPSDSFYSTRLKRLIAAARTAAGGEEPCGLDFVLWGDAQEDRITDAHVTRLRDAAPGVALVGVTFRNLAQPHSLRFTFRLEHDRWVLDDAQSLTGTRWVWSRLLKCEG